VVPVAGVTAVDLINYRQHLVRAERLQATTINRKIQALKKLFRWARGAGRQIYLIKSADAQLSPMNPGVFPDCQLRTLQRRVKEVAQ
jgi:Phage integrase, N-terminal SAM-like domain